MAPSKTRTARSREESGSLRRFLLRRTIGRLSVKPEDQLILESGNRRLPRITLDDISRLVKCRYAIEMNGISGAAGLGGRLIGRSISSETEWVPLSGSKHFNDLDGSA
jgi:hypothetical protein